MIEQSYREIYNKYRDTISAYSAEPLNAVREEAYEVFERMGFPTSAMEHYRRSDIQSCFATEYGMNVRRLQMMSPAALRKCEVPGLNTYTFYVAADTFVSDTADAAFDGLRKLGVIFGSLREVAISNPDLVSQYYATIAPHKADSLVAFNTAFAQDGFFLYVPKGVTVDRPIQLINVVGAQCDFLAVSRNLIVLDESAEAKVIICDHSDDVHNYMSDRVTEVYVGENASYQHYKMTDTARQTTNIASVYVRQAAHSSAIVHSITLQSAYSRNNIHIDLCGQYAETQLCGVVIADEKDHVDNDTYINHLVPNCKSTEIFKYVADDCAVCSFGGRILVEKDAQKSEAFQTNKNICVKPTAKMFTKPQLIIYADDVKCSHGATVGQIDETALFYLRQRGISEKEAKMLLMLAFMNDALEHIKVDALKARVRTLIEYRLRRETHKCATCNSCFSIQ